MGGEASPVSILTTVDEETAIGEEGDDVLVGVQTEIVKAERCVKRKKKRRKERWLTGRLGLRLRAVVKGFNGICLLGIGDGEWRKRFGGVYVTPKLNETEPELEL